MATFFLLLKLDLSLLRLRIVSMMLCFSLFGILAKYDIAQSIGSFPFLFNVVTSCLEVGFLFLVKVASKVTFGDETWLLFLALKSE